MALANSSAENKFDFHDHSDILGFGIPGMTADGQNLGPNAVTWYGGPKLVIVMVGLPARGKSYISKKLARYLNWLQYETRIFNAGQTRRSNGSQNESFSPAGALQINHPATFFDPDDPAAVTLRNEIALRTLDELLQWLQRKRSCIGILDATNSTVDRRALVLDRIRLAAGSCVEVFFLESTCNDLKLLEKNIMLKLLGPDYKNRDKDASLADFRQRVRNYEKQYTAMGLDQNEREFPYLQLIDLGRRVVANCINGFLSAQTVEYLLKLRLHERQIWITRNGESLDDAEGIIGRSSELNPKGKRFASALAKFLNEQRDAWNCRRQQQEYQDHHLSNADRGSHLTNSVAQPITPSFHVWTSMMRQAVETSQFFTGSVYKIKHLQMLNDLHAGKMEGMTFKQIGFRYSDEMAMRKYDPVYYRWPGTGGESYADVINRLRPIILELERMEDHVLLITHRAVARVLLAYFQEMNWAEITEMDFPPGRIFSVEPMPYGVTVEAYQYDECTEQFYHLKN